MDVESLGGGTGAGDIWAAAGEREGVGAVRSDRQTGEFTRIHDLAKAVYFVIWERQGLPGAGGGRAGQGSELAGRSGCVGHSGARWLAPAPACAAREGGAVRR